MFAIKEMQADYNEMVLYPGDFKHQT